MLQVLVLLSACSDQMSFDQMRVRVASRKRWRTAKVPHALFSCHRVLTDESESSAGFGGNPFGQPVAKKAGESTTEWSWCLVACGLRSECHIRPCFLHRARIAWSGLCSLSS